ncbi:MAG: hypothetical protein GEU80_13120 [Dehalococcoidia bacterium]|nr:hypothetical protein [Dehalococcoidia bacterium]
MSVRALLRPTGLQREHGQIAPLMAVALTLFALFGIVAIDIAMLYDERAEAQTSVDLAALAAAQELPVSPLLAVAQAEDYLRRNGWDLEDPEVTITVNVLGTDQVEVVAQHHQAPLFGAFLGLTYDVGARAVAERTVQGGGNYAILVLDETACQAFYMSGNGEVVIENGGIMVNSSCASSAVRAQGNSDVITDLFHLFHQGGVQIIGNADLDPMPSPVMQRVADPLAGVAPPDLATLGISPDSGGTPGSPSTRTVNGNGSHTLRPGVYYGGLDLGANTDVTLEPGIYALAGGGLRTNGNTDVFGEGVMIYNTEWDGSCGEIHLNGNAAPHLSGYEHAPYEGITFWQDAACTETMTHNGNADTVGGVIYLPTARYSLNGNGDMGPLQIIADTVVISGNGDLEMCYEEFVEIASEEVLRLVQ